MNKEKLLKVLHKVNAEYWDHGRLQRRKDFFQSCTVEELNVIKDDLHERIEKAWDKLIDQEVLKQGAGLQF